MAEGNEKTNAVVSPPLFVHCGAVFGKERNLPIPSRDRKGGSITGSSVSVARGIQDRPGGKGVI